ncbi:glycosyltransferase [bacterium]|nr:glycosyltransferase [bacterium]
MNKNKQPILSICIPTYNREVYLKRLVDSIISQKEFVDTDDIEIVISDNASTDSTKDMINKYINKY